MQTGLLHRYALVKAIGKNGSDRQTRMDQGVLAMKILSRFLKDQSGATAIEYGLLAAGISVAIIVVVQGLGTKLNATFTTVSNALR
jgi:pilus assembly protein Flp/PilA